MFGLSKTFQEFYEGKQKFLFPTKRFEVEKGGLRILICFQLIFEGRGILLVCFESVFENEGLSSIFLIHKASFLRVINLRGGICLSSFSDFYH